MRLIQPVGVLRSSVFSGVRFGTASATGGPTYFNADPKKYDMEQLWRPDEMAMINTAGLIAAQFLRLVYAQNMPQVLELCSGTGLATRHLLGAPEIDLPDANNTSTRLAPPVLPVREIDRYLGLDLLEPFNEAARQRFMNSTVPHTFLTANVLSYLGDQNNSHDVILGTSAYHHIEDKHKPFLMRSIAQTLTDRGVAILADNHLPEYGGDLECRQTVTTAFYREVQAEMARVHGSKIPPAVPELIKSVVDMGNDGTDEFKVTRNTFEAHAKQAGLKGYRIKVWPWDKDTASRLGIGGNYVYVLQRAKTHEGGRQTMPLKANLDTILPTVAQALNIKGVKLVAEEI